MLANFKEHAYHLEGCAVRLASAEGCFASFGSDDIAVTLDLRSGQADSHSLDNPDREEITALAMDPRNLNSFAIGTASGCVKRLWPLHQYSLRKAVLMYKCDRPIKALSFHPRGKLLGIATEDEQAFVYSIIDKRVFSLQKPHEGGAVNIFFAGGYVCSQGLEGYLHLYELKVPAMAQSSDSESEEPQAERTPIQFPFMDRYKIATDAITKRYPFFNAAYGDFKGPQPQKVILTSGQTSLQVIELQGRSSNYRIERGIREQEEILLVEVLSEGEKELPNCIVTSSASFLSIWNYTLKQRLFTLPTGDSLKGCISSIVRVGTPEGPSFVFAVNHAASPGKLYQFTNPAILSGPPLPDVQQADPVQPRPKQPKPAQFVSRWEEEGRLDKVIPDLTQFLLEKSYEQSQGARFLYYNNVGCVIERCEGGSSTIELDLHDKSRPKRLSLDVKNRPFWLFAIRQDVLVYATTTLVVFQCERHLKEGHEEWEFRWDNIQAVSIGSNWVALCSTDAVKVLDYSGNELHTFCFDRRLVAFEAYQDTLAIVFHSAPPMWGCQALKVRLYRITPEAVTLERDTLLPLKANSQLKWFGFSEEGMLYSQDTLEVVRGYVSERDEWVALHSMEGSTDRFYIQHISGTEIYGFKLEQKHGKREQPKVIPRSLPRRYPMEMPSVPLSFLTREEDAHLRRLRIRNVQLQHQKYRHNRWYKLKYSRSKNHIWYSATRSILSAEEIQTASTQLDLQLLDYLKKFLKRWEDRGSRDFQQAAQALMLIFSREAHFEDTKESARTLLGMSAMQKSRIFEDCVVGYPKEVQNCKSKIGHINILEKMLNIMNKT